EEAEAQAKKLLDDAQSHADMLKENKILEAKEHFLKIKNAHDKEVMIQKQKHAEAENRIRQQQQNIQEKNAGLQKQISEQEQLKASLQKQLEVAKIRKAELDRHQEENVRKLEKIAQFSAEEAKSELVEAMK